MVDGACCGQAEDGVVLSAGLDVLLGEMEDVYFDVSSGGLMGGLCEWDGSLLSYVLGDRPLQCPVLRRAWMALLSTFVLIGGG